MKLRILMILLIGWKNIKSQVVDYEPHTDPPQYRINNCKRIKTVALRGAVKEYKGENIYKQ
ncbi:tail protein [Staphylococcus phage S-CoN_Ph35]|nr:tail protein [Staphylococcus phage S-CoN_Ph35]